MNSLEIVQELSEQWKASGLKEGELVLIHSDLGRTLIRYLRRGIKISPQDVLESFIKTVGRAGTLIFPLFNFDFTKGVLFDIRHTPSHMGVITECARNYPGAVRTGHPIYSFAVIGAKAALFKDVNNFSGYGEDSPFGMLRQMGGKIAVLGLPDQEGMTFYHHVEEMNKAPYRYHKNFSGPYTDSEGKTGTRTYGLYVRNLTEGVQTYLDQTGELMWKAGLYQGSRFDQDTYLRVIDARAMFDFVSEIIKSGRAQGLLYKIELPRH